MRMSRGQPTMPRTERVVPGAAVPLASRRRMDRTAVWPTLNSSADGAGLLERLGHPPVGTGSGDRSVFRSISRRVPAFFEFRVGARSSARATNHLRWSHASPCGHHHCCGTTGNVAGRFCSDSIRTSQMVESGPCWKPSGTLDGSRHNVFLLGRVLDHGPVPKWSKHCGRAGRISPDQDAVQGACHSDPPSVHLPPLPNRVGQGLDFRTRLQSVVVKRGGGLEMNTPAHAAPSDDPGQAEGVVKQRPSVLFQVVAVAEERLDCGKVESRNQPVLRARDLDPGVSLRVQPAKKRLPAL